MGAIFGGALNVSNGHKEAKKTMVVHSAMKEAYSNTDEIRLL